MDCIRLGTCMLNYLPGDGYAGLEPLFCDRSTKKTSERRERPRRGQPGDRGRDRKPKRRLSVCLSVWLAGWQALAHNQQPPNCNPWWAPSIIVHIIAVLLTCTCTCIALLLTRLYYVGMHVPSIERERRAEQMRHTAPQAKGEREGDAEGRGLSLALAALASR